MSLWLPRAPPVRYSQCRRYLLVSGCPLVVHSMCRQQDMHTVRPLSTKSQNASSQAVSHTHPAKSGPSEAKAASTLATTTEKKPLLPRIYKSVKEGASHYWHGSKLLVSEVRISARLQWKLLHGEALTRREKRQVPDILCVIFVQD